MLECGFELAYSGLMDIVERVGTPILRERQASSFASRLRVVGEILLTLSEIVLVCFALFVAKIGRKYLQGVHHFFANLLAKRC